MNKMTKYEIKCIASTCVFVFIVGNLMPQISLCHLMLSYMSHVRKVPVLEYFYFLLTIVMHLAFYSSKVCRHAPSLLC